MANGSQWKVILKRKLNEERKKESETWTLTRGGLLFFLLRFGHTLARDASVHAQKRPGGWAEPPNAITTGLGDPGQTGSNPPLTLTSGKNPLGIRHTRHLEDSKCLILIDFLSANKT